MTVEDAEHAFLRHATSKIHYDQDLFHIKSLGFRGEALASIAAVSKLTLTTSQGEEAGTKIYSEAGELLEIGKSDARKGTEITVQDAEHAFLRHATSKIHYDQDLFHIKSLGFRGEALASIAAVSKLTLTTSQGEEAGTKIYSEAGELLEIGKSDARKGTEITVQ